MQPRLIVLQPTPFCNIACTYCYLRNRGDHTLMSREVIEAVREKIIGRLPRSSTPAIVWHAGEPTVAPVEWYEYAYSRLDSVRPERSNFAMQTNGIAINDRWIDLFLSTRTEVSLSIDGPQRFHDARRITKNGKPTWQLSMRGLSRLQDAGFKPRVITVLHPDGLSCADEYFEFYKNNGIIDVSFSIDELEGVNSVSSFSASRYKDEVVSFLASLLRIAFDSNYNLYIREIERVAAILAGAPYSTNELVEPWGTLVISAAGGISTFSPELMEVHSPMYNNFVFGNILKNDLDFIEHSSLFKTVSREIKEGVLACSSCRYFDLCGGGSPVNKYCEKHSLSAAETDFCQLTTQASTDALLTFLSGNASKRRSQGTP